MKRDSFYSKLAFYISLGFWIPLFNVAISITALILALMALKRNYDEPKKYGGVGYAIAAIILSLSSLVLTILGLIIYLTSDDICGSRLCQVYYQSIA